jgi:hypothetical protein
MTVITPENRSLLFSEVRKQPYAGLFSEEEINEALQCAAALFSGCDHRFAPGFCGIVIRSARHQAVLNYALELIPALVQAHRFFGSTLPHGLRTKLTNLSQTHDTLFELLCLGAFQQDHVVHYEPTLADGKLTDLMIEVDGQHHVYVECKSQGLIGAEYQQRFNAASGRLHTILDLDQCEFVKRAWEQGLRTEVRLSRTPSEADLRELRQNLDNHTATVGMAPIVFGRAICVSLVQCEQPFCANLPPPSGLIRVGTEPTSIHFRNVHTAVYPWPGLDIVRRRSQRRLLGSARRQMRAIPPDAFGLICIQTFSSAKFAPDIHKLLAQPEYARIPIVWLNPIGSGRVICRDDAIPLRNRIFRGMFERAQQPGRAAKRQLP